MKPFDLLAAMNTLGKVTHVSNPNGGTQAPMPVEVWSDFILGFKFDKRNYDKEASVKFHFEDGTTSTFNF